MYYSMNIMAVDQLRVLTRLKRNLLICEPTGRSQISAGFAKASVGFVWASGGFSGLRPD